MLAYLCVFTSESDPTSSALRNFLQDSSRKQLYIMMIPVLVGIFSGRIDPPCLMSLTQGSVLSHKKGSDGFGKPRGLSDLVPTPVHSEGQFTRRLG